MFYLGLLASKLAKKASTKHGAIHSTVVTQKNEVFETQLNAHILPGTENNDQKEQQMRSTILGFDSPETERSLLIKVIQGVRPTNFAKLSEQEDGMSFDQYDTPQSRWLAVHDNHKVIASIRLIPTTARVGIYSYVLRDAQRGLHETLPPDLLFEAAPVAKDTWEFSGPNISESVSPKQRKAVLMELARSMVVHSYDLGARKLIGLVPDEWIDALRQSKLEGNPIGPRIIIDGVPLQCVLIDLNAAVIDLSILFTETDLDERPKSSTGVSNSDTYLESRSELMPLLFELRDDVIELSKRSSKTSFDILTRCRAIMERYDAD